MVGYISVIGMITFKKAKASFFTSKTKRITMLEIYSKASSREASSMVSVTLSTQSVANNTSVNFKDELTFNFFCVGQWEDDKWNGFGKFVDREGKVLKAGVWRNDKFVK